MKQSRVFAFCILILLFIFVPGFAEVIIHGTVYEYNGSKSRTPLSGVEIVVANTPSTVSNKKGEFTLTFRTGTPGQQVLVRRISKTGYEVFNKHILDQWILSNDGTAPAIVMVRKDYMAQLRENYTNVLTRDIQDRKERAVLELQEQRVVQNIDTVDYEKKLQSIQDEFDERLEQLDTYIDHFVHIDLTTLSDQDRKIMNLVQQGKLDEAIRIFDEKQLLQEYSRQSRSLQLVQDGSRNMAQRLQSFESDRMRLLNSLKNQSALLRLAGGRENFEREQQMWQSVAWSDTTFTDAWLEYGYLLNRQQLPDSCINIYNVCAREARRQHKPEHEANALWGLSYAHTRKSEHAKSDSIIKVALKLIEPYRSSNWERLRFVDLSVQHATNLSAMASINKDTDNGASSQDSLLNEALLSTQQALQALLELQENEPDSIRYLKKIATTYTSISNVARRLGLFDEALKNSSKSVEYFQKLYQNEPSHYAVFVGWSMYSQAVTLIETRRHIEADSVLTESVRYLEEALRINPQGYLTYYIQAKSLHANNLVRIPDAVIGQSIVDGIVKCDSLLAASNMVKGLRFYKFNVYLKEVIYKLYLKQDDLQRARDFESIYKESVTAYSQFVKAVEHNVYLYDFYSYTAMCAFGLKEYEYALELASIADDMGHRHNYSGFEIPNKTIIDDCRKILSNPENQ